MAKKVVTSISIDSAALKKLDSLCADDRRVRGEELAMLIEEEIARRKSIKHESHTLQSEDANV